MRDQETCDLKPKPREKHYSYDQNVNEPAKLIDDEQMDIEQEIPQEDRQPIENIDKDDQPEPPIFEE